jgi:DNA-binding transcriptional ArsR family regulator
LSRKSKVARVGEIIVPNPIPYVAPSLAERREMMGLAPLWDRDAKRRGARLGPLGGFAGVAVLCVIYRHPDGTPSIDDIRRETGLARSTILAHIDRLERIGLLRRDSRFQIVRRDGQPRAKPERRESRFRLPSLAEFLRLRESDFRTAIHQDEESTKTRSFPPRRRPVDNSWEAPDAPPPEEEIEILTVEAATGTPEAAREEATDGESAAPPPPPRVGIAQAWPESLAEIAARRSAELWQDKPQRWATAPPGRILGASIGHSGGASPGSRPKTGLGRRYAAGSDALPDG